jgi:alcohol dehydrogenase/L-iditol 2-dehydrogenase
MKAIAVDESGALTVIENLAEPEVPDGHILIRMLAGGVCGSDLTGLDHQLGQPGGVRVIGHEGGGEVVRVADDVTSLAPGDIVVIEPNYACLTCRWCQLGQTKMCRERIVVGRDTAGVFSEFVAVPAEFAWKLPPDTPLETIASFEAAMVAKVAVDRMAVSETERVLVVGAGSQGQAVIALLLAGGIKPAVIEPNAAKLARALQGGGRDALADPTELFEVVFETSGVAGGLRSAIDRAEKLGRICLIGQSESAVPVVTRQLVQKELTLQGTVIYNHPDDFGDAVRELEVGCFQPAVGLRPSVGPRQAVHDLLRARSLDGKIWIDFTDWAV